VNLSQKLLALALALGLTTFAAAETLTGTVKNSTTNKHAAGDDVILLKLAQGMEEGARTKADAQGKFSFNLDDSGQPHLIRAVHQGVTYHKMAPPGVKSVELEVFDAAQRVEGISVTADVMRFQAENGQLEGIRLFAVNNSSSPPKTQMNDHNFEFYLPEGAQIDQSMAKTAGGQPLTQAPVPQAEKNKYAYIFPLRPGQTEFQVSYHLPYSGSASLDPKLLYPAEHFVVMFPKSMQFSPAVASSFQSMQDPEQSEAVVQVATRTQVGQQLGFKLSGTGVLPAEGQGGGHTASAQGRDNRPGGGIGVPIDAPDPLQKYRWYILGGFALVLAAGAIYVATRQQAGRAAAAGGPSSEIDIPSPPVAAPSRTPSVQSSGRSSILDALKEELFQLELDHKAGSISEDEYQKAKSALDQTLARALKRQVK
jgi:hypothetical protein